MRLRTDRIFHLCFGPGLDLVLIWSLSGSGLVLVWSLSVPGLVLVLVWSWSGPGLVWSLFGPCLVLVWSWCASMHTSRTAISHHALRLRKKEENGVHCAIHIQMFVLFYLI
ncbi:hypothetical protein NQD34_010987 [Periophthalmus magnuspinnatus]|nr:hypothetical protein NQD34_010987 [Periophthalmus magnuspinnatus]